MGPVAIFGGGAIGSYVGGMLADAGHDVVVIDAWPAHVEAVRANGLAIEGPDGTTLTRPPILHLGEVQALRRTPPRLVIQSVKLYDTAWCATLARDFLGEGVPFLTLQNALVEETCARIVGWPRVLGGIATGMNVELAGPGLIRRGSRRFGPAPVFKVGEMHGRRTPRAEAIATLLGAVDTAAVTTTLWNDRWQKLTINAAVSGLGGIADLSLDAVHTDPEASAVGLRLVAEACAVGRALGFDPGTVYGLTPDRWLAAAEGDAAALEETRAAYAAQAEKVVPGYRSGTLQDLRRGRRTEADFYNGFLAAEGAAAGVPAPTHAAIARLVHEIEAGSRAPARENLADVPR